MGEGARGSLAAARRTLVAAMATVVLSAATGCTAVDEPGPSTGSSSADCAAPAPDPQQLGDLGDPASKDIAMQLVSSAENSSLDWRAQYRYLEDIDDGRGYTGGIIGFTSGTGDMLQLVQEFTAAQPDNPLAAFLPALRAVDGTDSHDGLGAPFEAAWDRAATDSRYATGFEAAQDHLRNALYFDPAVSLATSDGLPVLGQFAYYDAAVVHGTDGTDGLGDIRATALGQARSPAQGGRLTCYLEAFWQARIVVMRKEAAHEDVSRITDLEQKFAADGNFALQPPLSWSVYGDTYAIP